MKLAALVDGVCAICKVSPKRHHRCGTCEGLVQSLRLCTFCDKWNKKNGVAWNASRLDLELEHDDDDDFDDSQLGAPRPLRGSMATAGVELPWAPARRRGRPRSSRIDDAVIPRLRRRWQGRLEVVERIDSLGRRRGTYTRWTRVSRREIARQAGCSHWAVDHRHHDYARGRSRNSRASSARPITK